MTGITPGELRGVVRPKACLETEMDAGMGPLIAESWQLPCKSRDTCTIVIEHVAFVILRVKKLKYVEKMTTAGVHVTLLLSSPRLEYCWRKAAWNGLNEPV